MLLIPTANNYKFQSHAQFPREGGAYPKPPPTFQQKNRCLHQRNSRVTPDQLMTKSMLIFATMKPREHIPQKRLTIPCRKPPHMEGSDHLSLRCLKTQASNTGFRLLSSVPSWLCQRSGVPVCPIVGSQHTIRHSWRLQEEMADCPTGLCRRATNAQSCPDSKLAMTRRRGHLPILQFQMMCLKSWAR